MAIEIVALPSYKMVIFHSYVTVYQRVNARWCLLDRVQLVYNSNFTMVFVGDISIVFMG